MQICGLLAQLTEIGSTATVESYKSASILLFLDNFDLFNYLDRRVVLNSSPRLPTSALPFSYFPSSPHFFETQRYLGVNLVVP
jgi:hypothetical protein